MYSQRRAASGTLRAGLEVSGGLFIRLLSVETAGDSFGKEADAPSASGIDPPLEM
jgi:hypothetical protein